ncbi:type II secretion system F family protein [Fusibacter tunisiensis]|uniref:Type IV pilus assembly protein PilC n=1 Tax=Fusibacter tunisiensis TaxID=1008308 RepID=A0ABS2MQ33_9FIRM|nr:type II secretion system F family protein [Fusibacter tunisiensis]MBM7561519.1 type IV pilus assembly protein PilC [Fusibacter tunisiensis]
MVNVYKVKEVDLKGRVIEQVYRGETEHDIVQLIRSKGHKPVRIEAEVEKGQDIAEIKVFQPKVKVKDIALFCKQLYTMLDAGMPLITALDVLSIQAENKTLKAVIHDMATNVQKGEVLSTAMKRHRKVFPYLLISMVEAGELTGNLDSVLDRMSTHYTKENRINSKIKGALMYPAILSIIIVVVVVFLLTFVLPTFIGMFESSGTELPGVTRALLAISGALQNYWYIFLAVLIGAIVVLNRITATIGGKRFFDNLKLKIPVVGDSLKKIATSRFTRTLSTLLASGIPIIQALETSANVTNNQVVIDGIEEVNDGIKTGAVLSSLLKRVGVFPPMMISMVGVGEESGALEEMLEKTADYYDEELETATARMISVIEPVMIVVMAVVVGFIVISMILPMFDMYSTIA